MRADLRALFHHNHGDVGVELLEADGRRQSRRAAADHHDVIVHPLAFRQFHPDIL
jgi:hypothetical protein